MKIRLIAKTLAAFLFAERAVVAIQRKLYPPSDRQL